MRLSAAQAQGLAVLLGWVDFHLRDTKTLGGHCLGNFMKGIDYRCFNIIVIVICLMIYDIIYLIQHVSR